MKHICLDCKHIILHGERYISCNKNPQRVSSVGCKDFEKMTPLERLTKRLNNE